MSSKVYQTIREWEGKTRKITQKEYLSTVGHGQYYPPEGCNVLQKFGSNVAYCIGGAHHKKPAHWNMADSMFRIIFKELSDGKNYSVDSFELIQHSTSLTAEAPKLAFSSGFTCISEKNKLVAFTVNGKSLNLRSSENAITSGCYANLLLF